MTNSNKDKEKAASGKKCAQTEQNGKPKKKPKVTVGRYCQLCAEHGGAERTHNTKHCCKYNADDEIKKSFCSKFRSRSSCKNQNGSKAQNSGDKQSFAAINSTFAEMKKTIKHGFHARHGKPKRSHSHHGSPLEDTSDPSIDSSK